MFFFKFKKNSHKQDEDSTSFDFQPLYEGDRGINDLHANDAEFRIYVSEPVWVAMKQVTRRLDSTLAAYLREWLVLYLYGAHELACMQDQRTGIYHPAPSPETTSDSNYSGLPMFSRSRAIDCIPGLGKNIQPLKLFLPKKMKDDLQLLADDAGVPLSRFMREILTSHFLGHTVWPEQRSTWTEAQEKIADQWVQNRAHVVTIRSPTAEEEAELEGKIEELNY